VFQVTMSRWGISSNSRRAPARWPGCGERAYAARSVFHDTESRTGMVSKKECAARTSWRRASAARNVFQVTTERAGRASKRREASAAEVCRQGAIVLADEFVGGGCNRRSGHRAGSPVRDGRREARWPSPHQEGNRRSSATWAWVGFNPYLMWSELPRQNGPEPNKMRHGARPTRV
jgi:hypothetical protein